jgi:hypothetical protein
MTCELGVNFVPFDQKIQIIPAIKEELTALVIFVSKNPF